MVLRILSVKLLSTESCPLTMDRDPYHSTVPVLVHAEVLLLCPPPLVDLQLSCSQEYVLTIPWILAAPRVVSTPRDGSPATPTPRSASASCDGSQATARPLSLSLPVDTLRSGYCFPKIRFLLLSDCVLIKYVFPRYIVCIHTTCSLSGLHYSIKSNILPTYFTITYIQ